ncbi:MAG: histidine kinase [Lachnospiraceae bacterium]|nr:histidine kinase [Lachnospiraceae bacterium]
MKLNIKLTLVTMILVTLLMGIFGGIVFYNLEKTHVRESISYMQSTMQRRMDSIDNNINAINMTTQFFLSNAKMNEVLSRSKTGASYTTAEWIDIYNTDVAALERLINTNPVINGARYYAMTDNVQEMLPVMYNNSRLKKQEWADMADEGGWIFDYREHIFSTDDKKLMALITPMDDRANGRIGYIETSMQLRDLFPSLYEHIEGEVSCFVCDDGQVIFGDAAPDLYENVETAARSLAKELSTGKEPVGAVQGDAQTGIRTAYNAPGRYIISGMYIKELAGTLVSVDDISAGIASIHRLRSVFLLAALIMLVALALVVNMLVNIVLKRFYEVLSTVREVRSGNLDVRTKNETRSDEMGELSYQVNRMLDRIQELMRENVNREVLAKDSQLKALQNQINAHFIYNVLESIKMMAEIREEYDISDAVTSLGKLLRYSMKWSTQTIYVSEEIEYIKNYMALINLRFDYEIYLSLNLSERAMKQMIPKMTLQPIVENAIVHGIEEIAEDTTIYIKSIESDEDCTIEITDNGRGMSEEELDNLRGKISGHIPSGGGSGNGIGLKNVQDRIRMEFGERYGIEVAAKENCYTKVCIRIPISSRTVGEEKE